MSGGGDALGRHAKKLADMQEMLPEMHGVVARDAKKTQGGGRMFRVGGPRCKKAQRVWRMFRVGGQRCNKLSGSGGCFGSLAQDAKNTSGGLADVSGRWPEMQKLEGVWRMFRVGGPRCKSLRGCGGCFGFVARDAKTCGGLADVEGLWPEMQRNRGVWQMFRVGGPRCKNLRGVWRMFRVGGPRCKNLRGSGGCLGLVARDAKRGCGWWSEMQKIWIGGGLWAPKHASSSCNKLPLVLMPAMQGILALRSK